MKRFGLVVPLLAVLAACPRDKQERAASLSADTTRLAAADSLAASGVAAPPGDLSGEAGSIPAAAPDTFKQRRLAPLTAAQRRGSGSAGGEVASGANDAPTPLLDAVQREQAFSRFCYSEFGQKADPSLRGNVAMVVTVGSGGITDARVSDSNWSGSAGNAVNRCLNEKAKRAWKLSPGSVSPGRYAIRLSFTGS